jgi:hypothetical protein
MATFSTEADVASVAMLRLSLSLELAVLRLTLPVPDRLTNLLKLTAFGTKFRP